MAGTNQFLPFGTAGGAAVLSQAAYNSDSQRLNGWQPGILAKERLNKSLRQANAMAAALGGYIANANLNANDDGNITALTTAIDGALKVFLLAKASFTGVGNQLLAVGSGFQKLPGGVIVQWGQKHIGDFSSGVNDTGSVAFPIVYPSAVFQVIPGWFDPSGVAEVAIIVRAKSTSAFSYQLTESGGATENADLCWISIGF